jgi:hypothetical protein
VFIKVTTSKIDSVRVYMKKNETCVICISLVFSVCAIMKIHEMCFDNKTIQVTTEPINWVYPKNITCNVKSK